MYAEQDVERNKLGMQPESLSPIWLRNLCQSHEPILLCGPLARRRPLSDPGILSASAEQTIFADAGRKTTTCALVRAIELSLAVPVG